MKKILTFLMVFVALFTFVACDTGNSSSGNGGNGTSNVETINPDNVAKEFADCTADVENMEISGGKWTVIEIYQDAERLRSVTLQATVEDNYFTYTSGTAADIRDASIMLEEYPEALEALRNAKNDEEKTAMMFGGMPEGATVTWDGLISTMTYPLSQELLEEITEREQPYDLFNNEAAVIKTNADKTKYVISITYEYAEGEVTETYYLEKN